eukprot:CAMPEP_0168419734 /NCGR_PEP_ID=MMETSP0228-20121227/32418_1 /TAXON_ID=133427 /ORGANISM="Protoceratium reticulatum, Strain CCCM 535 (=CCMP 1889)" /LENGTH=217 /DNA_ID=CAMNT_0008433619 /DNA_START=1 /DNA_END=650 /DNA_ORIENTATION=+
MPGMVPQSMMAGMAPVTQPRPAASPAPERRPREVEKKKEPVPMDPDVKELCDHFAVAGACAERLNEEMAGRQDTMVADLARLWELLDDVGSPTCLLELKIDEMKSGEFVGKVTENREVEALALNFDLSADAQLRLNEMVARRATRKGEDLVRMEGILEHSRDPTAAALRLAGRLLAGELRALPDLGEAEDVMRKFKLDGEAKRTLVEIVLARIEDSS